MGPLTLGFFLFLILWVFSTVKPIVLHSLQLAESIHECGATDREKPWMHRNLRCQRADCKLLRLLTAENVDFSNPHLVQGSNVITFVWMVVFMEEIIDFHLSLKRPGK